MKDINTYNDLVQAVQLWLNRKDNVTIDNIPMFINMALKTFTRMVRMPYYEVLISTTAIGGYPYVVIPNDFVRAKHVTVNGQPYNRVDVETFLRIQDKNTNQAPLPQPRDVSTLSISTTQTKYFFTRVGGQLRFIPELQEGDAVEMIYQRDIPEFKDADADKESYILLTASDVMLYLSLRHASIFLRDPEQEQYWMQKATDAANTLQTQLDDAEWSGSVYVVPMFME